jgi:TRAP-type C4-dicarboxylate transport system permease large subunit
MVGMITPPVGMLMFVVSGIDRIRMTEVFREILPFVFWALIVLLLMVFFPPITTWLPGQVQAR